MYILIDLNSLRRTACVHITFKNLSVRSLLAGIAISLTILVVAAVVWTLSFFHSAMQWRWQVTADLQLLRKSFLLHLFLCCLLKALLVKEHDVDRFRVDTVISVLNTVCIDSRQYSSTVYPRIKCSVGGSGTPVLYILHTLAALYNQYQVYCSCPM